VKRGFAKIRLAFTPTMSIVGPNAGCRDVGRSGRSARFMHLI